MKKILSFGLLLSALAVGQASSLGLGVEFNAPYSSTGIGTGAALTFQLDKSPWVFGVGLNGGSNYFHIGATADMWLAKGKLIDFLNWYAGPGLYAGLVAGGNTSTIDVGLRIPVGLNAFLLSNKLELFLEVAPALGLNVNPLQFPTFGFQDAIGFRFWF